ncbi:hypothetical protein F8388_022695 [Cannabis sativa]|uniref:CCHC-type domain-containing protein n=1 Tax=Cannabis sativa TaxID=3483 RepID=A0A7J6G4J6_CANSA|nr:hypothetical protein F8388_022695 [Cannabis sativa]
MVIVKDVGGEEVVVQVDFVDGRVGKVLEQDSSLEMEMMELFEDISLEDILVIKACVGKVVGCKDMAASVVKQIVLGIWNLERGWKMKKFDEGVLGFFFDSEDDCTFIMNKRPWLVNAILLNLKPWTCEQCFFLKVGANPDSWIRFKYEKLPFLCFNCGRLAHSNGECSSPTAWVTPATGDAVCMYGPWIKVEGPRGNFFSTSRVRRDVVVCDESFKVRDGNHRTKGAWKRRSGGQSELKIGKSAPVEDAATDSGCFEVRPAGIIQDGTMHGVTLTMQDDEANATTHTVVNTEGIRKENVVSLPPIPNVQESILKIPPKNIILELPNPDFAFPSGPNDGWDLIPDFGPTLVQSLEIRHIWSCKSQRPHDFPEPISLRWPSNDPKLQKVYCVLLGPDIVDLYKAQPSLISNPPNIFELIVHLLGNRKRKAHTCNGVEGTHMESAKFQPRSCDGGETSRRQGRRGRPQGVSSFSHGKSGVKTRRRKRAKEDEIKGNIKGILAQCVDAPITFISNFGDGEEATKCMPQPAP